MMLDCKIDKNYFLEPKMKEKEIQFQNNSFFAISAYKKMMGL